MNHYELDKIAQPGDIQATLLKIKEWVEDNGESPDHNTCALYLSGNEGELKEFVNDFIDGR